ncbi:hypothetical protein [Azohydromonas australica]|uniref:hypothetical protein n=1 Tax=Azohydromonas australica TaxID=364039 RepID=UPI0003FC88FB|nr:hypothetical protein [Azohydromonas australica]
MAELETAFATLLGRQPTQQEIQELYRVKNALHIGDNDALWIVLMALQSYETLYRRVPATIGEEVRKIVADQRTLIAQTAEAETKRAFNSLAEAVSQASVAVAATAAESRRVLAWGWALLALVGFGSLCMVVGASLATGHAPPWLRHPTGTGMSAALLSALAQTPAGWIAALAGGAAAVMALWQSRAEIRAGQRLGMVASALCLIALCVAFLLPTL